MRHVPLPCLMWRICRAIGDHVSGSRLVAVASLSLLVGSFATSQTPLGPADLESTSTPIAGGTPFPSVLPGAVAGTAGKTAANVQLAVSADMIGFSHVDGSGTQTITLVHTGKSWMAVYHVDSSGVIQLVSSRPIDADFSLQFNAAKPLPEEIRALGGKPR